MKAEFFVESNDLKPLHEQLRAEIEQAVQRVLNSGWYLLGPEVEAFEQEFADYHGVAASVAVANGTDAVELSLRAFDIGPGDEVITVAHTAMPTVVAIERAGATPVLVDIDPMTYTMEPERAREAITARTKAILPVHLYGHPADMSALRLIAQEYDLLLIEDCAQAHGAQCDGELVGTFGDIAAFSAYPTKNLAAYGDAGVILVNDIQIADRLKRLRNYGQSSRYEHLEWGINSRMDELQAAILRVKLRHLDSHNARRREIAEHYQRSLTMVNTPIEVSNVRHVYHLFVVETDKRDQLQQELLKQGVKTLIHYPVPIHLQKSHMHLGLGRGSLPVTEAVASRILSLPLYIGMPQSHIDRVIELIENSEM